MRPSTPPRAASAVRRAASAALSAALLCAVPYVPYAPYQPRARADALAAPGAPGAADDGGAQKLFSFKDARIDEASGLAASRLHPGIFYTFNDSGGAPQVYAVGPDGRTRATLTLGGAHNRDWEAMAIGRDDAGRPALYLGDIGDNEDGQWPYVTVYRITEPAHLASRTLRATAFKIKYADGARNAESMMIDPRTNRLYIASKEIGGSLYEAPRRLRTGVYNVVKPVGDAPLYATDAAYAPDGRSFVIRTYWDAELYSAPGKELARVQIPGQKQGEGIAYSDDGRYLLIDSEGVRQPVWRVPLPAAARPSPTASPPSGKPGETGKTASGDGGNGGGERAPVRMMGLAVLGGIAVIGVVMFARRKGS